MLKPYLKHISEIAARGDAREETYYSALRELLEEYARSTGNTGIYITTLPKKTEAGNPDFRVWDGKQHIVGYIEAKDPTTQHLDQIEASEQLKRYRDNFPNLILTNFYEFRLYRNGKLIDSVLIGRPVIALKLKTAPPPENEDKFADLLEKFFSFSLPKVYNAKNLAIELAKRTRFLKEQVIIQELEEEAEGRGSILAFYDAFKQYLIAGLTKEQFANLYSQTITYGLFAARTRTENEFNRKLAYDFIPPTIGILRDVFKFVSFGKLSDQMECSIDDISGVLAVTDVNKLLHQYFHEGKGKDPVVHFYETFLAEYDPQARERRGVYYTPQPVVSYIVRSLHKILKEHFGRKDGFADTSVTVLDPAAGTLTFLAEAAKLAVDEFVNKYGESGKEGLIKEHILKNFYAFELMMAPYAVGHLKMSFLLEEMGYRLQDQDRFKLYLTNTLEMKELEQIEIPGLSSLSEESHLAGEVKRETPILVILGNPPYSVSSANKSEFIENAMDLYKEDVRKERNIQPLSDDYIKFIRFAHWKIEQAGKGVVGMITNNSYLSGLIHRGMRKKLLESFDEIYILNLHGNARIGERCPDGSKDENVFDIMQGVSIALFIKDGKKKDLGKVFYCDLYGLREAKYNYLLGNDLRTTKWTELDNVEPYYFFVEKDFSLQADYEKFWGIKDIFGTFSSGVKTHRDHFIVAFTKDEVKQRMQTFTSDLPDEIVEQALNLKDTRDWKMELSRNETKKIDWRKFIRKYSYRPFDIRYICYTQNLIDRGCDRLDLMGNFFYNNLGLSTIRSETNKLKFSQIFITELVTDIHYSGGQSYIFPLYLYPSIDKDHLFNQQADAGERKPNIHPGLFATLGEDYGTEPAPEEIFYYIYGVLYSNIYRKKYAEFLKIDFPRIPFTKDKKLFSRMGRLGKRLVDLHLLKSPPSQGGVDPPIAKFQGKGDNRVEKLRYDGENKRLHFNPQQYVEGISKEVWEYQIGGYQVCHSWLNYRKKRILTLDDIKHYCRVVTALSKTIEAQNEIDKIYPRVEKSLVEVAL